VDDHHHLAASFVSLHDAMRLADFLEAEKVGFALRRPAATCSAIFWSGTSVSGNCGSPNTKLPKKVR
jgi:hypothetical protein